MKVAEAKTTATAAKSNSPFFQKGAAQSLLTAEEAPQPFFQKKQNDHVDIQAKLSIGQPNDKYEQEADAMADKVVQRLSTNTTDVSESKPSGDVQAKPLAATITPVVQKKCATCGDEEKLQKKEEEADPVKAELQQKPMFESNTETPPDEDVAVQRKCEACEHEEEEKLQKKSDEVQVNDKQVQEVNTTADKAVQLQTIPDTAKVNGISTDIQPKPAAAAPAVQKKCSACGEEEKLQKKEEEADPVKAEMQKNPVFEGNAETPPDDDKDVQRKCAACEHEEEKKVQAKESNIAPAAASASVENALSSSKGSGSPLPAPARSQMESSFGADFSGVRIHDGSTAVQMSKSLNAQAFTHGNDIYFNSGKYNPESTQGRHLLAHELTHTVQQGASKSDVNKKDINAFTTQSIIHRLTASEQVDRGVEVYDLLDGWTSSGDSADILSKFTGLGRSDVNGILNALALHATQSVLDIYKWMHSDMVASDWQAIVRIFVNVTAEDITELIAFVVLDMLEGWTSEEDSREIRQYLSDVSGSQLDSVLTSLETQSGNTFEAMVEYLFGDLQSTDAHQLSLSFFGSGGLKATQYSIYWYALKVKNLIAGYTSIRDSNSIVQNFQRVPDQASRIAVLTKLGELCTAEWGETAAESLMNDMQQADYNTLRGMMPQLPLYDIQKNFLERGWDLIEAGYDYVEGFLEYVVCGIVGIVVGIFDAIVSVVSGIVDIGFAIKHIIGWLISKASGGRFGRESEEKVNNFFTSVGQALGAPGDMISRMWNATVLEASLIEGPFEECQLAIFWVRRVTNFVVNVLLLIFAGYGAVKAAIEAIEAIKQISTFAEFASKIGRIPMTVLRKIASIPGSLAAGGARIISAIRNVDQIIIAVRRTIGLLRLAAQDENFYLNLRRAAGEIASDRLQAERDFWRVRKERWSGTALTEEQKLANAEGLVDSATTQADTSPALAEQQAAQAEEQALLSQHTTGTAEGEVRTGRSTDEPPGGIPGRVVSAETQAWERGLNAETRAMLESNPELRRYWQDMDPSVRRALTFCNSPCIPVTVSPENLVQIRALIQRLGLPDNHRGLREYLHIYRNDQQELANAIRTLDSVANVQQFEAFLDNRLIAIIRSEHGITIRRGANGLWEYPSPNGVITEFETGTHSFLTGNRGTDSFFQSHHGIQDAWARERLAGLGVYGRDDAPAILLRTRNIEGGSRGTPHGLINDSQGARRTTVSTRTFAEERQALVGDMNMIGAPPPVQAQYLAQVDGYFGGIYNRLRSTLTQAQLEAIFGTWHP